MVLVANPSNHPIFLKFTYKELKADSANGCLNCEKIGDDYAIYALHFLR
jgi:hypothetical protein